jgi:DinB superfamily
LAFREVAVEQHRKAWNQDQQALRQALSHADEHARAVELFLSQHAMVHSAALAPSRLWSFADEVWQDLSEAGARCIPPGTEHSIAWLFWHIARIEDVTMNVLVAGRPQLLLQDRWFERLKVVDRHTGNAMPPQAVADLSAALDLEALRLYRLAVGRQTRQIVMGLSPEALRQKVESSRLQRLVDEEAVVEAAYGLIDYWGGLKIAGLLLMPPTRHNFIHLNEALRVKKKCLLV